jgi:hypothetical protein
MSSAPSTDQTLQTLLNAYSKGLCDKMRTLDMVAQLRKKLSDTEAVELRMALRHLFEVSDMTTRNEGGRMVNMAALTLSCLAELCPAQQLLELVLSRFPIGNESMIEIWVREMLPELQWNLIRCPERVDADAINRIKAQAALVRASTHTYPPSAVSALEQLERTAEHIEFERFANNLSTGAAAPRDATGDAALGPKVTGALMEASQRLRSDGEFDPKTAADLIRTAMEEAHREFVTELEVVTKTPYAGDDKDGARRNYMRAVSFITKPEEVFFSAIYGLISREGSHRLIAPRETVLLLHQTVFSYLLLLTERLRKYKARQAGGATT